jgi:putative methionine-R-sulfoxide reductase with GAF domain
MTNPQTPNDDEDKILKETIHKKFKSMFSDQEPPAYASLREIEAMQARIHELEVQLGQRATAAEKMNMERNETTVLPLPNQTNHNVFQRMFNQATAFLNDLSYPHKFIIISFLFLLPLLVFYPLVNEQLQQIKNYGHQELRGANYLDALVHLLNDVQTYQIEVERFYLGENSQADLQASEAAVDLSLENFSRVHILNGVTLGLSDEPSQLSTEWEAMKSRVTQRQAIDAQHTQFVEHIQELIFKVGNNSYLILDPDLDTYYTMDAVLLKIPENQTLLFQILALSSQATRAHDLTPEQSAELTVLIGRLKANLEALNTNIGVTIQTNKSGRMQPLIESVLSDYSTSMLNFLNNVEQELIVPTNINVDPGTLWTDGQQVITAQENFFDGVSQALRIGIQDRINKLTNRLFLGLSLVFITAIAAFVIGLSVMNTISRPLQSLASAAQRLASGDMTARAQVLSGDEVGQTAAAFNAMADRLSQTLSALTDRTRDLTLATEVSQRISEVRDIDVLLTEAVELIQNRFDLYYAQVYLLDDARQNLILHAGTGEAGKIMLLQRHKVPQGKGLVGRVAETDAPILVSDVSSNPDWLPNPLLSETKSEVAVPISIGNQVLGVLDVQHNVTGSLKQEDADLLQSIANQVAIAVRNARSFVAIQQRADREALITSISRKIQDTTTIENALQVAIREIGRALGSNDTRVILESPALTTKKIDGKAN